MLPEPEERNRDTNSKQSYSNSTLLGQWCQARLDVQTAHLRRQLLFWSGECEYNYEGDTPNRRYNNPTAELQPVTFKMICSVTAWKDHTETY